MKMNLYLEMKENRNNSIWIILKEKYVPECELKGKKEMEQKQSLEDKKKEDESIAKAESESEIIKIEAEKMKAMPDTMEKDEELMK